MRVQYTSFARENRVGLRKVGKCGPEYKWKYNTQHYVKLPCVCPRKIFVNPAMQISLSDANPLFAFENNPLFHYGDHRVRGWIAFYFSVLFFPSFVFGVYVIHRRSLHWTPIRPPERGRLSIHNAIKQHARTRGKVHCDTFTFVIAWYFRQSTGFKMHEFGRLNLSCVLSSIEAQIFDNSFLAILFNYRISSGVKN